MKNLIHRYIWLIDTISRADKITFGEISAKWRTEMSEGNELALRTFHNHRIAIEDLFGINIECDKNNGYVYYIENKDDMEQGGMRKWLLDTFAVNNLINESHKLKQRILFEEIPSGQHFLTPVIEAMRDSLTVEITYRSFWHDKPSTFELEPYCVKVFRQRWYLLAFNPHYKALRIYALDRISELRTVDKPFSLPKDFDAKTYFEHNFGITVNEIVRPCTVKIKAFGNKRSYLRTLPLHHSQEEIETADGYGIFSYYVSPTFDFRQEILSHGDEVEVVSPDWFRSEIKDVVQKINELYKPSDR
ncbi:MAG: WYL domain-containing protein [Tannerella sp.]|jgi:hypothetical protein|nr:WYL domain-containing protein [Tannerella sp.]